MTALKNVRFLSLVSPFGNLGVNVVGNGIDGRILFLFLQALLFKPFEGGVDRALKC